MSGCSNSNIKKCIIFIKDIAKKEVMFFSNRLIEILDNNRFFTNKQET